MDQGEITCRQCEREVDDSLTWCPYCGAEQQPSPDETGGGPEADTVSTPAPDADQDLWVGSPLPKRAVRSRGLDTPAPGSLDEVLGSSPSSSARILVISLSVLLLIGAVAAWFFVLRDDNRGDLSLFSISAGDCWNDPEGIQPESELADVPQVPCDEAHANEVFAVIELSDGGSSLYPGQFEIELLSFTGCLAEFEAYVGVPYGDSPLDIYTLYPTSDSWMLEADRGVVCSVYMLDGTDMTGSMEGTGDRLATPALNVSGVSDCPTLADDTLTVAQGYIDYFESMTPEELEAAYGDVPPALQTLYKSESLISARARTIGCSFEDLNILVMNRAGALTFTTEIGASVADEIANFGFFVTG